MFSTTIDEVEVDDELDSEDELDMESGGDDILEGLSGSLRAPLHALFYGKNNHRFDSYSIMNNKGQHQVQSLTYTILSSSFFKSTNPKKVPSIKYARIKIRGFDPSYDFEGFFHTQFCFCLAIPSSTRQKIKWNEDFSSVLVPWSNAFWPGLTPFGPHMWQAGAETELTLTVSPTTAVGQKALFHGKKFIIIFALKSR